MRVAFIIIIIGLIACAHGFPTSNTDSLIVTTTEEATSTSTKNEELTTIPAASDDKKENTGPSPKISDINVKTNISSRYAQTTICSKIKNPSEVAQEVSFFVIIPERAFISGFIMELNGKNYTAYVDEKEKAKTTYQDAIRGGIGAGHVEASARDSNKFTVSTNVEPGSKAVFYLTYEELLQRKNGLYELVVNIHPGQIVKHMNLEVSIHEERPIVNVKVPPVRSGNEIGKEKEELDPHATIQQNGPNDVEVKFTPDIEQQKLIAHNLGTKEDEGIAGQFVMQYDVEGDPHGGDILVKDGHFVHFFSPKELQPLNKHVVFVLDTSGSMYDKKMEQLKDAMKNILSNLKSKDFFNLVEFNSNVKAWNLDAPDESTYFPNSENEWYNADQVFDLGDVSFPPAYPVNNKTLKKANAAVEEFYAHGGTNIYEALRVALHMIKQRKQRRGDENVLPLIVFLTDGDPTVGKTSQKDITSTISEFNADGVPIISLSFGEGADRDFLKSLSSHNKGFARHIYEDSDATLQLEDFYNDISAPLLKKIKFEYTPDITSLTNVDFPLLFKGGELVVAGKFEGEMKELPYVTCWGRDGLQTLKPELRRNVGGLERLWAYMTVKRYLDARDISERPEVYEKKALDLALRYSFVTPVTSLVVVRPDNVKTSTNTQAADGSQQFEHAVPLSSSFGGGAAPMQGSYSYKFASVPALALPAPQFGGGFGGGGFGGPPGYAPPPSPINYNLMMPQSSYIYPGAASAGFGFGGSFQSNLDQFGSPDGDSDAIDNKFISTPIQVASLPAATTTFRPYTPPTTTTEAEADNTTPEPVTLPSKLQTDLPWLQPQVNPDGSLKFLKGNFKLGLNETSPVDDDCTDPKSEEGFCKLLTDCDKIYADLTDEQAFKDYLCIIDKKFVGVCCPK